MRIDTKEALHDLLVKAVLMGASDVILRTGDAPWARVHGQWKTIADAALSDNETVTLANIIGGSGDIATRILSGTDLDFSYEIRVSRTSRHRFRVNATACRHGMANGISITMRTIPEYPPALEDLDLDPDLVRALFPRYGLVLVTGPVGSGKTTLLFSALRRIAETSPLHIITYEAPIEFDITSLPNRIGPVEQTEIGPHLKDFRLAPRNSLRRAGDVVLFGESRDAETIRAMSIEAETGVAVYSTVHTNSVAETLSRMAREFPQNERDAMAASLISAMRLIVHQRLLKKPGGEGRIAVREWLVFDGEVRSALESEPLERLIPATRELLEKRKTRLIDDLVRKYESGVIDRREFEDFRLALGTSHDTEKGGSNE